MFEFFPCDRCSEIICDCSEFYIRCRGNYRNGLNCDRKWCCAACAGKDGYTVYTDTGGRSCKFCRQEDFTDTELLNFFLNWNGIDRECAVREYKDHIRS